jgi:hypothetical protein
MVEISRQIDPEGTFEWYGLLNHSGQLGNGFFEPLPVRDLSFSFTPRKPVRSVTSMQSGETLPFSEIRGSVQVIVPVLRGFDGILVKY